MQAFVVQVEPHLFRNVTQRVEFIFFKERFPFWAVKRKTALEQIHKLIWHQLSRMNVQKVI